MNRVKLNQKTSSEKIYFSAASAGLFLFGSIISKKQLFLIYLSFLIKLNKTQKTILVDTYLIDND